MNEDISVQAWRRHCALRGADADWDSFTRWLEVDLSNREAYDAVALIDDALDRLRDQLAAALHPEYGNEIQAPRRLWSMWALVVVALALFVAIPMLNHEPAN